MDNIMKEIYEAFAIATDPMSVSREIITTEGSIFDINLLSQEVIITNHIPVITAWIDIGYQFKRKMEEISHTHMKDLATIFRKEEVNPIETKLFTVTSGKFIPIGLISDSVFDHCQCKKFLLALLIRLRSEVFSQTTEDITAHTRLLIGMKSFCASCGYTAWS